MLNDNLLNSKLAEYDRLWILSRIGNVKTALGVVHFPNDGVNKPITDSLMFEFLENCTELSQLGYETITMGDFNGRYVNKCEFSNLDKMCDLNSYNVTDYANLLKQVNCA